MGAEIDASLEDLWMSLRGGVTRHDEPKHRLVIRRVDVETAAMCARDRFRNKESETEAVAATHIVTTRAERLEDSWQDLTRNRAPIRTSTATCS